MATPALPRAPVLGVEDFGQHLIKTGDLDPVCVALADAGLPRPQLCRWLVAYWCFYHAGVASRLSEHEDPRAYWGALREAATTTGSEPWPRNVERRHFRGAKAVCAVAALSHGCPPAEDLIRHAAGGGGPQAQADVAGRVQEWPVFGEWISLRATEMLDVLGLARVAFSRGLPLVHDEPRRALDLVAAARDISRQDALALLLLRFCEVPAPVGGRRCGAAEVETILRKWRSHQGGSHTAYALGHDTTMLHRDLDGWGETADMLAHHAPPAPERVLPARPVAHALDPSARAKASWTPERREAARQSALARHARARA